MAKLPKCEWCGKNFVGEGTTAKYCSEICRKKGTEHQRKKKIFETMTIEEVVEEAKKQGMSYGEYTAKALADLNRRRT
ncbi:MAG: hypothetical protein IJ091_01830 [Oscillospiraceae bacterium]|nr:hypothetical protein [Oscillospiraceae bacterium]